MKKPSFCGWIGTGFLGACPIIVGCGLWSTLPGATDTHAPKPTIRVEDGRGVCMGDWCEGTCGPDALVLEFRSPSGNYLVVGGHEGGTNLSCRDGHMRVSWDRLEDGGLLPGERDFSTIQAELEKSGWVLAARNTGGAHTHTWIESDYQHNRHPHRLKVTVYLYDGEWVVSIHTLEPKEASHG